MECINNSCDNLSSFSGFRMLEWHAVGLGVRTRFALTAAYALVLNSVDMAHVEVHMILLKGNDVGTGTFQRPFQRTLLEHIPVLQSLESPTKNS